VSRPLRVGLVGAGWVAGDRHLPAMAAYDAGHRIELVGICDRHLDRARALVTRWRQPGTRAFATLDVLLDEALDVVVVATPPWAHHDVAVAALAAGAHVFTEKPMAMDHSEAQDMADRARQAQRILCVSHNFRFSRSARRAHQLLAPHAERYLFATQLSSEHRRLPSWCQDLPGGLLFDEIPHLLYLANDFLGGALRVDHVRVAGRPAHRCPDGVASRESIRSVDVLVSGAGGSGQLTVVLGAPVSEWHVSVVDDRRVVDVDLFRDVVVALGPDGKHGPLEIARTSLVAAIGHLAGSIRTGTALARHRQSWGHAALIAAFLDAVVDGGPSPVPLDEALAVVKASDQVVGAVVESEAGRTVAGHQERFGK